MAREVRSSNKLTVDDYFDLSVKDRTKLDEWLKALGGHPNKTKALIIDRIAKTIIAIEWLLETHGKNYTGNTIVGEHEILFTYTEEPPVWTY